MTKWSKFLRREEWRLFPLQERARVVREILRVNISTIAAKSTTLKKKKKKGIPFPHRSAVHRSRWFVWAGLGSLMVLQVTGQAEPAQISGTASGTQSKMASARFSYTWCLTLQTCSHGWQNSEGGHAVPILARLRTKHNVIFHGLPIFLGWGVRIPPLIKGWSLSHLQWVQISSSHIGHIPHRGTIRE